MAMPRAGNKKKSVHVATKTTPEEKELFEEKCSQNKTTPSVAMRRFIEAVNYGAVDRTVKQLLQDARGTYVELPEYGEEDT